MAIDKRTITIEQAELVVHFEEGHFSDVKSIDIAPAKLTNTIAALANADGGEIYVGVDERKPTTQRTWRGFSNVEHANGHIQAFEPLFPLGTYFEYTFLECDAYPGTVLQVQIRKTPDIKRASDGIVYLRRGAQNLPVSTPAAMKQLEFTKGLASFETELISADSTVITNSLPVLEFMLQIVPAAEPGPWLTKQQLLRQDRPTVAGVVLFAEEPQALIPKHCGIKIYRYRTRDLNGTRETLAFDPITVEGHAYAQIREAVRYSTHRRRCMKSSPMRFCTATIA